MDTLHTFNPTLNRPASVKASPCALPPNDNDQDVVADDEGADGTERVLNDDSATATEHGPDAAGERVDAAVLPLDLLADLIGAQEDDAHDLVDLMIASQKTLELVQEGGKRIHQPEAPQGDATEHTG